MLFPADAVLDTAFTVFAADATYMPPSGPAVPCRAIPQHVARPVHFGAVTVMQGSVGWHLLRADFSAEPVAGGTLTINGDVWTLDHVGPCDRDPRQLKWAVQANWGAPTTYRAVLGSDRARNPPLGSAFKVSTDAAEGAATISVRGANLTGQVMAGDRLAIGAVTYTVGGTVQASAGGLTAVPIAPPLTADAPAGTDVLPAWARDYPIRAALAAYGAREISGGIIAGDRRLVIMAASLTAAGCTAMPKTDDEVRAGDGPWLRVITAAALFEGASPIAWDLQVRG